MLLQFRKLTRGAVAGGILLLIAIATLLFLPQGANFNLGRPNELASVGPYKITASQLTRELDLQLRRQRQRGANLTQQEAIDAGYHMQVLEGMISRYALYRYADKLGVSASDRQVGNFISHNPNTLNPITGQFDEATYDAFLQQVGYSRDEFQRDIRGDLANDLLLSALVGGARPPSSFGALQLVYQTETRVVSVAEAGPAALGAIPAPTESQLRTFYEQNQDSLRVPEFRAITLVLARPQDFESRVQIQEAELTQEVEARRASAAAPERRTYVRINAPNQQQAQTAASRIAAGEAPAAVAQALGLQMTRGENKSRAEVPDTNVAEAVFSMGAGAPPRVVRGELFPFVVVRVENITAAASGNVEELRAQVRAQMVADKAAELLQSAIEAFEEARDGGTSPAAAARANGLPAISIPAVSAEGRDQSGQPIPGLENYAEALRSAFEMQEGEAGDFVPAAQNQGDVLVSVDSVTPARVHPFDEVREQLTQLWLRNERTQRLQALGREVAAAVAGGQSFEAATRARHMTIPLRSRAVDRMGVRQIPARALGQLIFNARQGEVVSDMRADGNALLLASVEQINRVNPSERPELLEAARSQSTELLQTSMVQALQAEAVRQAHPRRNEGLIERTYRRSSETENEPAS